MGALRRCRSSLPPRSPDGDPSGAPIPDRYRTMRTLAIVPVKQLDSAKQRLAALLGAGAREALAQAMFTDVLAALRRVELLQRVAVVTGDATVAAAAQGDGVTVLDDPAPAGQSAAAAIGIRHAIARGYERVLLVPGDTPLLDPQEVDALLAAATPVPSVTIVADRHGEGTNGLAIVPPGAFEPSFGPGSLERHLAAADAAALACRVHSCASLAHDVDTPEDLAELWTQLDGRRGLAPRTRGALRQLDRARVAGSASIAEIRDRSSADELDPWTETR